MMTDVSHRRIGGLANYLLPPDNTQVAFAGHATRQIGDAPEARRSQGDIGGKVFDFPKLRDASWTSVGKVSDQTAHPDAASEEIPNSLLVLFRELAPYR